MITEDMKEDVTAKAKQVEFLWDAKFTGDVGAGPFEIPQLIAAKSLRKALVKAEKYQEKNDMESAVLVSLVRREDVIV